MASLIYGVNHAGSATDGVKFIYVYFINGRSGGNTPSVGFNYVQRYDVATNTFVLLAPSPQVLTVLT